ncbi:MAG: hypothetical protein IPK19_19330 [Chloroflexi bacterium]|nr:hypothetical protein [Chloroflexota bacterium]
MANTIEIVVRAVDQATRPLREIGREVDALAARLRQIGGAALPTGMNASNGLPSISMPSAAKGGTTTGAPIQQTTVIQVTLPESALRDVARAEAAGERFGEAIARRLRERG